MQRNRKTSAHALLLLTAMMEQPRAWQYGYELAQETQLKSGTLYPILMRLCDRKLLESKWQPSSSQGRPPRHMYRLTASGTAFAKEQLANSNKTISREALGRLA
jgi:PadR family transcriptional regulator, regulatory protein PadR